MFQGLQTLRYALPYSVLALAACGPSGPDGDAGQEQSVDEIAHTVESALDEGKADSADRPTIRTFVDKIAIVLDGANEDDHQANVERAVEALKGYRLHVAARQRPKRSVDFFTTATAANVRKMLQDLQSRTAGAEVVVYTTGHGDSFGGVGTLCLQGECRTKDIAARIDKLPYRQRTVITDQCFGGNWNKVFLDDPRTLFIAAGGPGESVRCGETARYFWARDVPDANGDGVINWQERFAHAVTAGKPTSHPQFIATRDYTLEGKPPFPADVIEVSDKKDLEGRLGSLKPGQHAVIDFSTSWCGPCKNYYPQFVRFSRESQGWYLFLHTENEKLAEDYKVIAYPTLLLVDHAGNRNALKKPHALLDDIASVMNPDILSSGLRVPGIRLKRGTRVQRDADAGGQIQSAELMTGHSTDGPLLPKGTLLKFYNNGALFEASLDLPSSFHGIRLPRGTYVEFNTDGTFSSAKLPVPLRLNGIHFPPNSRVTFLKRRVVQSVEIEAQMALAGTVFPARTMFYFSKAGKVSEVLKPPAPTPPPETAMSP